MKISPKEGNNIRLEKPTSLSELKDIIELEQHSIYKVSVSMREGNPWFEAFLIIGFMNKDSYGGYCELVDCQGDVLDFASPTLKVGTIKFLTKFSAGHVDIGLPY